MTNLTLRLQEAVREVLIDGTTQDDIAEVAGVSQSVVSNLKRGNGVSLANASKLIAYLESKGMWNDVSLIQEEGRVDSDR
jgi:predicted XRE-type DNA-binding protein